jgi:hypothetical protein
MRCVCFKSFPINESLSFAKHIFVAFPPNVMIYMTVDAPKDWAQVLFKCNDSKNNDHAPLFFESLRV